MHEVPQVHEWSHMYEVRVVLHMSALFGKRCWIFAKVLHPKKDPPPILSDNEIHVGKQSATHETSPPAGLEPAIFGLEVRRLVH